MLHHITPNSLAAAERSGDATRVVDRLVYFTDYDISVPGGPRTNESEFVRILARTYGTNAIVVVPRPENALTLGAVNYRFVDPVAFRPTLRSISRAIRTAFLLRRLRRDSGAKLIVARLGRTPIALWLLAAVLREPVALKTVEQYWYYESALSLMDAVLRWIHLALTRSVLRHAVAADSVTEQLACLAQRDSRRDRPVAVIGNAVDVEFFKRQAGARLSNLDLAGRWPVLGFVGSLPSLRGAKELVDLAVGLKERWPLLSVIVAGWDDRLPHVQAFASERGVDDRCHFLGIVPFSEVPAVVSMMDIGISFDLPDRARQIGNSSQKLRQYLACGVPVLTMPQSNEFVEMNGLGRVCEPDQPDELLHAASQLIEMLAIDSEGTRLACRAYAEKYLSIQHTFERRVAVWTEALELKRRSHVKFSRRR